MKNFLERVSEMDFAYPWLLLLLLLVPVAIYFAARQGPAGSITFSSTSILAGLAKENRVSRGFFLHLLSIFGLIFLVLAVARPRLPQGEIPDSQKGIDVMLVLDFSKSMDEMDYVVGGEKVSRLSALSNVIGEFLKGRSHDRFGVVGFAKYPYLTSPLTLDYGWIESTLQSIQTELGTAVGESLHMGVKYLLADELKQAAEASDDKEKDEGYWYDNLGEEENLEIEGSRGPKKRQKVIILVSDGINNAGKAPMEAARFAKQHKIRVHTIRINPDNVRTSQLNKEIMYAVAKETGGEFFQATNTATLLSIYQQIDKMEKTIINQKRFQNFEEIFQWFAWAGLGLLSLHFLLWQTVKRSLP